MIGCPHYDGSVCPSYCPGGGKENRCRGKLDALLARADAAQSEVERLKAALDASGESELLGAVREKMDKVRYWMDEMHGLIHVHGLAPELVDPFESLLACVDDLEKTLESKD